MQKDLENLAKEMQKLEHKDRRYWLEALAHCQDMSSRSVYPLRKIEEDFRRFKGILTWSLSGALLYVDENPLVKKGVDSFMSASKEEKDEFYKVVQTAPYQEVKREPKSSARSPKRICKHDRRIKIVAFDPSGRVKKYE